MMTSDYNLDDKARWFQSRIYGGVKGALRLDALWGDMLRQIRPSSYSLMSVRGAGGGLGCYVHFIAMKPE